MNDDEALKRGAEAGWALGLALKEVLPERSEIAIRAAILALSLMLAPEPASACHRYSYWAYKVPQHCQLARPAAHEAARGPAGQPSATASFVGSAVAAPASADDDKSWYVEIKPETLDEISHGLGIEKIRELNQAHPK